MSEHTPLISIVLPTYNGARYLAEAIESCLAQTHACLELIVVDDGSTDNTVDIVSKFVDERVRYIRFDKNKGHIAALNKGFAESRGEWLTWTSDDNYYAPTALEVMGAALVTSDADFVYARYQIVDEHGELQRLGRVKEPHCLDEDNYVGGCFLYTRKVYTAVGDFNPQAFLAEDYEYWLRVREQFRMKMLDDVLYYYRSHGASLTGRHKEEKVQEQVQRIREDYLKPWKKWFFRGKRFFNKHEKDKARRCLLRSWMRNPFYPPTWRMLMLLHLPESLIRVIRCVKHLGKAK